ncbi:MAG: cell division protein DamX [Alteromonas sp. Nap_26]|nr:MAG: cell division protein DamX [Alteromonas sp. Nap_26]
MQSELHERLEYLVNYSSQLIFVSGDSIAEQQKTLEAFVFQQHDDTEIAYLTAQENMEPSDYRRQLCRQLLGQVVGSFVRPLNELLSDLNNHNGPILIAITQAHFIPDKLLQELWDLVLQSRFAGNKQHLNVLLFANSQWAEKAKQWLPAKNTETPLIISSQSVISEQPTFESDLDKMIASRREAFQAHLENRQRDGALTLANPLKSKWLYSVVVGVFLSTFAGLVYWQYADNIAGLFSPIDEANVVDDIDQVELGSAYSEVLENAPSNVQRQDESQNKAQEKTDRQSISESSTNSLSSIEIVNQSADQTTDTTLASKPSLELASALTSDKPQSEAKDTLVTNWNTAISTLENRSSNDTVQTDQQNSPEPISTAKEELNDVETPTIPQKNTENPNRDPDLASNTESWIKPTEFVIQMLAMKDNAVLQQFLSENDLVETTRIYKTYRYGGDWYVVVDNTLYPTFEAAQNARAELKDFPGKENTFVKRGDQVLTEISMAQE